MQFTLRTMLLITAMFAVGAWLWPKDLPARVHVLAGGLAIGLAVCAICTIPAWRSLRATAKEVGARAGRDRFNQGMALAAGLLGMMPPMALLLVWFCDPHEPGHRLVHTVMVCAGNIAIVTVGPIIVLLIISLSLFLGYRANPPLLLMRLAALATNVAWPLYFYFAIVPTLV